VSAISLAARQFGPPAEVPHVLPAVAEAVAGVRVAFDGHPVHAWADGHGGAHVMVLDVYAGPRMTPATTWLGFHVNHLCPATDTYPHYVRGDLVRADGAPHTPPISGPVDWHGTPALQVSRASHRRNAVTDTPGRKAHSVLDWLRTQT